MEAAADAQLPQVFDLVIVGSGVAAAYTLLRLIDEVRSEGPAPSPVRVAVVEKAPPFWTGIPYGPRSSANALIITTFEEFVPAADRPAFETWLSAHRSDWTQRMRADGGEIAAAWQARNAAALKDGDYAPVYIPRRLFGDFKADVMAAAIAAAEREGLLAVSLLVGEVVDLERRAGGGYALTMANDTGRVQSLHAGLVLLAVGSPPGQSLKPLVRAGTVDATLVDDVYAPAFADNLTRLYGFLAARPPGARSLLLVGANASALETAYMLAGDGRFADLERLVVLSPGGAFPHRISGAPEIEIDLPAMRALLEADAVTPQALMDAAEADVARAVLAGVPVGDGFGSVGRLLGQVMARMPDADKETFHTRHGMRFSRLIRRAGREYRDAADALRDRGVLVSLAAGLTDLRHEPDGWHAETTDGGAALGPFAAVANCCGFEPLTADSTSPLIAALIGRGLAKANATGRGLAVDDTLAAAPGLFVNGPLLGGIFNDSLRMWHVENVRRISDIAPTVARSIAAALREAADRPADPVEIHPTADVMATAIGPGTRIGAYCVVLSKATIGSHVEIAPHCFIENDVVVGDRVRIGFGVQLWDALRVEDDVRIDANVTFTTDRYPRSKQYPPAYPETRVCRGAVIGSGVVLVPGVTIGPGAVVPPGTIVTRDVHAP